MKANSIDPTINVSTSLSNKELRQQINGELYNLLAYAHLRSHPEYGQYQISSPQETHELTARISKRLGNIPLFVPDGLVLRGSRLMYLAKYENHLMPDNRYEMDLLKSHLKILHDKSTRSLRLALADELGLENIYYHKPRILFVVGARGQKDVEAAIKGIQRNFSPLAIFINSPFKRADLLALRDGLLQDRE